MKPKVGYILIPLRQYISNRKVLFDIGDRLVVTYAAVDQGFYSIKNLTKECEFNWGSYSMNDAYFKMMAPEPPKNDIEWLDRIKENFKNYD